MVNRNRIGKNAKIVMDNALYGVVVAKQSLQQMTGAWILYETAGKYIVGHVMDLIDGFLNTFLNICSFVILTWWMNWI